MYDKSIQTSSGMQSNGIQADHAEEDSANGPTGGIGRETEAEMRARIIQELDAERLRLDAAILDEKQAAAKDAEARRKKALGADTLDAILASTDFVGFIERSSKVVQRAMSDNYDYLRDYSIAGGASAL